MKVFKFIPVLVVILLMPSFVGAKSSDRGKRRQYTVRSSDRYAPDRAPAYGRRAGYDRGRDRGYNRSYDRGRNHKTTYGRRQHGHDDHAYCDHRGHDSYGHSRRSNHRRSRRGIHFGGVIVIRF